MVETVCLPAVASREGGSKEYIQADGRIRRWVWVEEEGRYLRVILLKDGQTVHNAFFDRGFKET